VGCSGLVLYAAYQASGRRIRLPHYTGDQIRLGQGIAWADKQPGDLVFFGYPGAGRPHHVAIYGRRRQDPPGAADRRPRPVRNYLGVRRRGHNVRRLG